MKKAWELSVLCSADVSIVIFSAAGKAYEFSSKELDVELDRYLDVSVLHFWIPRSKDICSEDPEDDDDSSRSFDISC